MRDALPKRPWKHERIIVNLDSVYNNGTHWVCVMKMGNTAAYFDPMGDLGPPSDIISYLGKDVAVKYNTARHQPFNSVLCGHLCLAFLTV